MQIRTAALALSLAAAGLVAGQAMAQDRDVRTVTRETPSGAVVTKRVVRDEEHPGAVHRVVRVHRPDGTTVIRRVNTYEPYGEHHGWHHGRDMRMHRTVVIHHREVPMQHVVVRNVHHHPAYVVNRHVTVIHREG